MLPAPYVKVYLVSGKKCIDKMKTSTARRTLEPLYQQQLVFQHCNTKGCVLQVSGVEDLIAVLPIEGKRECVPKLLETEE